MKLKQIQDQVGSYNPLEAIENIAEGSGWSAERMDEDEVSITIPSQWASYRIHFLWQKEIAMLYMACFADLEEIDLANPEFFELLYLVNQRLWMGHFDVLDDSALVFRHTIPLRGTQKITPEQVEDMTDIALGEFNLFYPAFKHLLEQGGCAQDAFDSAMIDTVGEA